MNESGPGKARGPARPRGKICFAIAIQCGALRLNRDPIKLQAQWLIAQRHADAGALEEISSEVRAQMEAAVKFAIAAPYPGVEQVDQDVYA